MRNFSLECQPLSDIETTGAIGVELQDLKVFSIKEKIEAREGNMNSYWCWFGSEVGGKP